MIEVDLYIQTTRKNEDSAALEKEKENQPHRIDTQERGLKSW